jgi:hypothetical protein
MARNFLYKPEKTAKPAKPADPVLIDLSERVEKDLLLSDEISKNPFMQSGDMLNTWQPLQPVPAHGNAVTQDAHSLNPFKNEK